MDTVVNSAHSGKFIAFKCYTLVLSLSRTVIYTSPRLNALTFPLRGLGVGGGRLEVAIQERAEDGDGGSDGGLRGDLVAEGEDGETNHENTLAHVGNGVRHGLNLGLGFRC